MNERRAMRFTESQQHERRVARLEALRDYGRFAASVDSTDGVVVDSELPAGNVESTDPASGASVSRGTRVTVS
ncbi:PASTA domain-containing protein [Cryobacterium sp. Hz9]|uniref:PASTA domain-containing protein n=1 Tax=Cryobacterium sp. Hz9 TaxID=1259167 RepID=UPI00141A93D3|nr:PASTA domain-containing protein [Cryobacterium sp. Hz9]